MAHAKLFRKGLLFNIQYQGYLLQVHLALKHSFNCFIWFKSIFKYCIKLKTNEAPNQEKVGLCIA